MGRHSKTFADIVKDIRKQLGLSQKELAHALGVTFATVNRWENGKTSPSKLARHQLNTFCEQKVQQGLLDIEVDK